jgi:4-aminobutyrate aminotransferase-like enzyme
MRVAKRYSGKSEMVALESSFHGRTNATLSITGNSARKKGGYTYLSGIAFAPAPYCYRCFAETTPDKCDLLCARRVSEVMRLHLSGNVCAFIAEPVMGEGGIIVPPDGYFKRVKQILDDEGALFICDEVQSGFGRTGKMFAIEHYGVDPDIICMAKGIANGWPLGAFTATAEIADSFQVGDHLSTFGGNPVSCAASLANIAFFEETGLVQQSATKGAALKARFEALMKEQPLIGDVRGKGLMIGVELVQDRTTKVPASAAAGFVRQYCLDHGVLIGVGGNFASVLRIQPPLVITEQQMDKTFTTVADALKAAAK